jgi:pimeloyl-ACP methyl ester carboxylesterase
MNIAMIFLLFSTLLLKNVNAVISFDTQAFALAYPCVWSTCEGLPSEEQNYTVSCCILQVPLNYAQPNQSSISISMLRLNPPNPNNNFLFALNGGPGEAGLGLVSIIAPLIPIEYGITIIFPDHRGTGFSSPLGCDNQNSQIVTMDCITYLTNRWTVEGLNQFSTTSAAHDLAIQIQAAQLTGRIAILAVSYGTYWLNRFLTIYPNLVQAAVMDSPVNPLLHAFSMYNVRANSIALQFLAYCHYQIECIQHFPNNSPATMLYQILQEMDSNNQKCINTYFANYNLTSSLIKSTFFSMFQSAINYYDRTVIPAVIFRLDRCNKDDVAALDFFFSTQGLSPPSSNGSSPRDANGPVLNSDALYYNIAFSELWLYLNQSEVDQQILNTWQNVTIIAPALPSDLFALKQAWPKYSLDEYRFRLANSSVLIIAGQLDAATPLDFTSHLASITGKTRIFYSIPLSGHIIQLFLTVTGYTCPLNLILSWVFPALFPSEWNDPACIQDLPITIDFVGATEMGQASSLKLLNISLPFGNTKTSQTENRASSDYSLASFIFIFWLTFIDRVFFDIQ